MRGWALDAELGVPVLGGEATMHVVFAQVPLLRAAMCIAGCDDETK